MSVIVFIPNSLLLAVDYIQFVLRVHILFTARCITKLMPAVYNEVDAQINAYTLRSTFGLLGGVLILSDQAEISYKTFFCVLEHIPGLGEMKTYV